MGTIPNKVAGTVKTMERTKLSSPKQKRSKRKVHHREQSQPRASGRQPQTIGAPVEAGLGLGQQGVESQKAPPPRVIGASSLPDAGTGDQAPRGPPSYTRVSGGVRGPEHWAQQLQGFVFVLPATATLAA